MSKYELCLVASDSEFRQLLGTEPYRTWAAAGDLNSLRDCLALYRQFPQHLAVYEAAQHLLHEAEGSLTAPDLYVKAASCLLYYPGGDLASRQVPVPETHWDKLYLYLRAHRYMFRDGVWPSDFQKPPTPGVAICPETGRMALGNTWRAISGSGLMTPW